MIYLTDNHYHVSPLQGDLLEPLSGIASVGWFTWQSITIRYHFCRVIYLTDNHHHVSPLQGDLLECQSLSGIAFIGLFTWLSITIRYHFCRVIYCDCQSLPGIASVGWFTWLTITITYPLCRMIYLTIRYRFCRVIYLTVNHYQVSALQGDLLDCQSLSRIASVGWFTWLSITIRYRFYRVINLTIIIRYRCCRVIYLTVCRVNCIGIYECNSVTINCLVMTYFDGNVCQSTKQNVVVLQRPIIDWLLNFKSERKTSAIVASHETSRWWHLHSFVPGEKQITYIMFLMDMFLFCVEYFFQCRLLRRQNVVFKIIQRKMTSLFAKGEIIYVAICVCR